MQFYIMYVCIGIPGMPPKVYVSCLCGSRGGGGIRGVRTPPPLEFAKLNIADITGNLNWIYSHLLFIFILGCMFTCICVLLSFFVYYFHWKTEKWILSEANQNKIVVSCRILRFLLFDLSRILIEFSVNWFYS